MGKLRNTWDAGSSSSDLGPRGLLAVFADWDSIWLRGWGLDLVGRCVSDRGGLIDGLF